MSPMNPTTPPIAPRQVEHSSRLRPGVALHASHERYVLRVDDQHHDVRLSPQDAEHLLDALVGGGSPTTVPARAALAALVDAGLVDGHLVPAVTVAGSGPLADAVTSSLRRMGSRSTTTATGSPDLVVRVLDDPAVDAGTATRASTGLTCWIEGHHLLVAPPRTSAKDVASRREAALRRRRGHEDPRTAVRPGGRVVASAHSGPSPTAIEVAAVHVAVEALRRAADPHPVGRSAYEALVVDLRSLVATRRPVLPVPVAPR